MVVYEIISIGERKKACGFVKMPSKTLKYLQILKIDFIHKRCHPDFSLKWKISTGFHVINVFYNITFSHYHIP